MVLPMFVYDPFDIPLDEPMDLLCCRSLMNLAMSSLTVMVESQMKGKHDKTNTMSRLDLRYLYCFKLVIKIFHNFSHRCNNHFPSKTSNNSSIIPGVSMSGGY